MQKIGERLLLFLVGASVDYAYAGRQMHRLDALLHLADGSAKVGAFETSRDGDKTL